MKNKARKYNFVMLKYSL